LFFYDMRSYKKILRLFIQTINNLLFSYEYTEYLNWTANYLYLSEYSKFHYLIQYMPLLNLDYSIGKKKCDNTDFEYCS
jgi:hypothetical protein